jgi:thiazolylpeptide-type bacteriocin precursor
MAKMEKSENTGDAVADALGGIEIEKLELNEFVDDSRLKEGGTIAKVMAASCTSCECCCSY